MLDTQIELLKSRLIDARIDEVQAHEQIVDDLKALKLGSRTLRGYCEDTLGYTPGEARRILIELGLIVTSGELFSTDQAINERIQKLRAWRMMQARAEGVTAYRILSNRALMGLATRTFRTSDDLLSVTGVGAKESAGLWERFAKIALVRVRKHRSRALKS